MFEITQYFLEYDTSLTCKMPSQILGKKILGREVMTQRCLRTALGQAMRHIESASNSFGGQRDFVSFISFHGCLKQLFDICIKAKKGKNASHRLC